MKHGPTVAVRTSTAIFGLLSAISLTLPLTAATLTIPDSSLIPSTQLYTDTTGSGIGNIVVMTGGGNASGVGDPSGRNDDGFSGPINLGFTLNFFGTNYTQFWINNNGNVSFGNGISDYTPTGPTGASQPIISPFFADVDTRGANSGVVHLLQLASEDIVTWDAVGYYDSNDDKLDTFQLVLRGPGYSVPAGQGQIGFFYTTMQWETGDDSGGTDGFGGTPAAVGFGDGAGNGQVLQGSIQNGISGIVNDKHIWFNLNGSGVPVNPGGTVPEPASVGLLLVGVGGLALARKKFRTNS
jgi:hypothetical protein